MQEQQITKPFYKSKRFWVTVFTTVINPILIQYVPPYAAFVATNPEVLTVILGAAFGATSLGINKKPIAVAEPVKKFIPKLP